jgi:hypothetical protein
MPSSEDLTKWLDTIDATCAQMSPLLAGLGPERQAAVLAALMARFVAGWHPDLRDAMLQDWVTLVRQLTDSQDLELYGTAGFPKDGLQ